MLYLLGLRYGAAAIVLEFLGIGIGKTSVYRAVQAVAEKAPGMKQTHLLQGYQTKAVNADVLVCDDADAFKKASDETGRAHQVCKSQVG